MRTVLLGPPSPDVQAFIDRRRTLGQDGFDEVWDGEYHVAPMARSDHGQVQAQLLALLMALPAAKSLVAVGPFNLGLDKNDFRVPDGGFLTGSSSEVYVPSAVVVLEVLSPDDETFDKFAFYCRHGVREVIVADPGGRTVVTYRPQPEPAHPGLRLGGSRVLGVSDAAMQESIRWPGH